MVFNANFNIISKKISFLFLKFHILDCITVDNTQSFLRFFAEVIKVLTMHN